MRDYNKDRAWDELIDSYKRDDSNIIWLYVSITFFLLSISLLVLGQLLKVI